MTPPTDIEALVKELIGLVGKAMNCRWRDLPEPVLGFVIKSNNNLPAILSALEEGQRAQTETCPICAEPSEPSNLPAPECPCCHGTKIAPWSKYGNARIPEGEYLTNEKLREIHEWSFHDLEQERYLDVQCLLHIVRFRLGAEVERDRLARELEEARINGENWQREANEAWALVISSKPFGVQLKEARETIATLTKERDELARALYPDKQPGFTYSHKFMVEEIERRQWQLIQLQADKERIGATLNQFNPQDVADAAILAEKEKQ